MAYLLMFNCGFVLIKWQKKRFTNQLFATASFLHLTAYYSQTSRYIKLLFVHLGNDNTIIFL